MDPSMIYNSQLGWSVLLVLLAGAGIAALEWRERAARRMRRPGERRR